MKRFRVDVLGAAGGAERTGWWEASGTNSTGISTPALWVGTRCFAIPNLTPETWKKVEGPEKDLFAGLLVPFQHITNRIEVMEAYGAGKIGNANSNTWQNCLVYRRSLLHGLPRNEDASCTPRSSDSFQDRIPLKQSHITVG